jgi:hypothetical protein
VVVPDVKAVTTPEASIVPTAVFDDDHVPPAVALVSVDVPPIHSVRPPVIAAGTGLTVIT